METHDTLAWYRFKTVNGTERVIQKKPEIEDLRSDINEMSEIGKLTHLFWGFNIVDYDGLIMRKFKFLATYPKEARSILKIIYPKFFGLNKGMQDSFRRDYLSERIREFGFTIQRTSLTR